MQKAFTLIPALGFAILAAQPVAAETWLFAAAACPPWKSIPDKPEISAKMAGACEVDVNLFVDGFKDTFDVADDHIITLIDADATGEKVAAAIADLASKAQPDDRVILYVNTHGGKVEAMYKGYSVQDEIFAWYTEEKPQDFSKATEDGRWMTTRAFRDSVNAIMSNEIVTVIEACHADASLNDFINNVHDGIGGRGPDWPGREAVIFSAHEEQIANFTPDGTAAIFTKVWSDQMLSTPSDTLFDSFEAARLSTHRAVRENCADGESHEELVKDWINYRDLCTQMPTAWDPFGLLDDITLPARDFGAVPQN